VPTAVAAPGGLVSWWTADNTAADLKGLNNATLLTGATYAPGVVGQAFSLDGVNARVEVADSSSLAFTASFSIEGWIKVNGLSSNSGFGAIMFRGDDRNGLDPYQLTVDSDGNLNFQITPAVGNGSVLKTPISTGQWTHVAATFDDATGLMSLYVNGVMAVQTTTDVRPFADLDPNSNPGVGIGNVNGTADNFPFNGLIDELSVYNRALTPGEIVGIFKAGSDGKVLSPIAVDNPSAIEVPAGTTQTETFTITRTGSLTGPLTVNWATADDTAKAGTDYVSASGTVTFADGQATQTVQVTIDGSNTDGPNKTFKLVATPAGGTPVMGVATILNNNSAISISSATAQEGDATIRYFDDFVPAQSRLAGGRHFAFGGDGNLYVTSRFTNEVLKYDGKTGAYIGVVVPSGSFGLHAPWALTIGPDGNLYVAGVFSNNVLRYDLTTGAVDEFIPSSAGVYYPKGLTFDSLGDLLVSCSDSGSTDTSPLRDQVLRFQGPNGASPGAPLPASGQTGAVFVTVGSGGLSTAQGLAFGPDGNLYVASAATNTINRYNGTTGAFIDTFVSASSADLNGVQFLTFRPDGFLYVSSQNNGAVYRYNAMTGAFAGTVVPSGSSLDGGGMAWDVNGNLYVMSGITNMQDSIRRYGVASQEAIVVSLDYANAHTITVGYATADGTALAGTNYRAVSGTVVFAPGETSKTILIQTLDDGVVDPNLTFSVNLSSPSGATILHGRGTGTIIDKDAQAPAITSANKTAFVAGTAGAFTVTATGSPTPTLTENGTLPTGITFDAATSVLSGAPSNAPGTGGIYPLTFTASNGVGVDAIQNFTLTVNQNSAITSPNNAIFTLGAAGSFTVTASGFPVPTLTESGALPKGVSFNPATRLLGGTPAAGTGGTYALTFTATNGLGAGATQSFTLNIDQGAVITSVNKTTFAVGNAGSFTITTTGSPTPALVETGALPAGVTFNAATGVLSGTPAAGVGGIYPLTFTANNGVGATFTQTFTLTVNQSAAITTANETVLAMGKPGSFKVTATGFPTPVVSETGALPSGVTFDPVTGFLSGTPAAGSSGAYPLVFTASNGIGPSAVQSFTLTVSQAPAITSGTGATFNVGSASSFAITTAGFPLPLLSESGALPTGVSFNGVSGILSGTPASGAGGSYVLKFTASNGTGADDSQSFTLTVTEAPAITSPDNVSFAVGITGSYKITVSGFPAPLVSSSGALPGGVSFDSATGVLSGSATAGTGGSYPVTFTADNGIGAPATLHFVLTVNEPLAISSMDQATFWIGRSNSFVVSAPGFPKPALIERGTLPAGVTFDNATGTLGGSPQIGTDGSYPLTFVAENGVGTEVTQNFNLVVQETANQRYVSAIYQDLLGHAPDAEGLAYWSGLLDSGISRAAVLNLFDHGIWYFSPIINSAYQQYLGRTPDSGGLVFWIQQMINGVTDEQLEANLIASTEFYQHAGGADSRWVDAMYQDLLGRQPDSQGEAFWTEQLATGISRAAVAHNFTASNERESQQIAAYYQKYLGRSAGSGEIDYWLGRFGQGLTNEDIITGLLVSGEYYKKRT
jgi:sugar lactone lactonase YvrE